MLLASELYENQDVEKLQVVWDRFPFFSPRLGQLRSKFVSRAIREGDSEVFLKQAREGHFPEVPIDEVRHRFVEAANHGISALNELTSKYVEDSDLFMISPFEQDTNFLDVVTWAKEKFVEARLGKHAPIAGKADTSSRRCFTAEDYAVISEAYKSVVGIGLGNKILMIESDPLVQIARRRHPLVLERLTNTLEIERVYESDHSDFSHIWTTGEGIELYGQDYEGMRSRVKALDDDGNLRYGSILMKMFSKGGFVETVKDHTGIEFVVRNAEDVKRLVGQFKGIRGTGKLEAFKSSSSDRGESSSSEYKLTKFIYRPPVATDYFADGVRQYERVPVEVQILDLESHEKRINDPKMSHEGYKERQFSKVFPMWYPKDIYEPLLSKK